MSKVGEIFDKLLIDFQNKVNKTSENIKLPEVPLKHELSINPLLVVVLLLTGSFFLKNKIGNRKIRVSKRNNFTRRKRSKYKR